MHLNEPVSTAVLLAVIGVLLALSAIFSRASRLGIPIVIVFLLLGMLSGSEGVGHIPFEDYHLSFRVGTVALVLILFDGGLNTPRSMLREFGAPALTLATAGVLGTAALVGLAARALGFSWSEAFLLGSIVSSTDAAAVFSVLRSSDIRVHRRVHATLEAESGLNDPMAVSLTLALTGVVLGHATGAGVVVEIVVQLVVGACMGLLVGRLGRWLLGTMPPVAGGLYPVLSLALAFLAFGITTIVKGSGFLAVYLAGIILGNGPMPNRNGILRVHDALAWLGQAIMFLALGLLVFPSHLMTVARPGLAMALLLALVIRPLITVLCLAPFRYPFREQLYIGWMGLRGAVPIILGTFPVLAGVPSGERMFDIVFFVVGASVLLQGGTARWVTRRLRVGVAATPPPPALVEMTSMRPLGNDLFSFAIRPEAAVAGVPISEVPLPEGSGFAFIIRGSELVSAAANPTLEIGDHAYVFCRREDRGTVQLLFGQPEL
jgi:cell volume regulation protein A